MDMAEIDVGIGKTARQGYRLDDVAIVPSRRTRNREDVDLSWRLQLAGYEFAVAPGAAVAKRDRASGRPAFRAAWTYGQSDLVLYRRYRAAGMRRDVRRAAKAWIWLVLAIPGLVRAFRRRQWVATFGMRGGRLAGSVTHRAFFP